MSDSASRRAVALLRSAKAKAKKQRKQQKRRSRRAMGCGCLLLALVVPVFGVFVITSMMVMGKASHDALVQQRESKYQNSCVNRVAPNGKYANPAVGTITSRFGLRDNPIPGATLSDLTDHPGTDIAGMAQGTPFYAAAAGTVLVVDSGGAAGGNGIIIQGDDGVRYWYWHAATGTAKVKAGDHVEVGQELAGAGATGYATGVHLHFQIMLPDPNNPDGKGIPTDPEPYMAERGITLGQGAPDQVSDTQKTDAPTDPAVKAPKTEAPSPKVDITPIETDLPSGSKYTWDEKRVANAADIIAVGKGMGVPERGIIIALMTSLQENALENTPDGDRDSVGLFQQRPSALDIAFTRPYKEAYAEYDKAVSELREEFPVDEGGSITVDTPEEKARYIELMNQVLLLRQELRVHDEFIRDGGDELISDYDMQGYTGVYNDIYEEIREMRKAREEGTDEGDGEDRTDEVDLFANVHFQTELVKQQEIGVSYILALIEAAHDSNGDATEDIERAVNSSSELRASADIITDFSKEYRNTPNPGDVYERFHRYVTERRVEEENVIVRDENLDPEETQRVVNRALREGRRTISGKLTSLIKVKMPLFGGTSDGEGAVSKTKRVKQRLENHLGRFMSLLGGR